MHTVAQEAKLSGHHLALTDCQISPEGTHAVTASLDRTVRVWRLDGLSKTNNVDGKTGALGVSPKHSLPSPTSSSRRCKVLSGHKGGVMSAQFSPRDGRLVLSTSVDYGARLWNADTGKQLHTLGGALNKVLCTEVCGC